MKIIGPQAAAAALPFDALIQAMHEVITWLTFYYQRRLHSALGSISPMKFEESGHAGESKQAA